MAALLARVAHAHARMRFLRSVQIQHGALATRIGVSDSLAWRTAHASIDVQSFSTTRTREDRDLNPKQSGSRKDDGNNNSVRTKNQRANPQSFAAILDARKQWIEELASRDAFDTMLHAVYACYRPLYEHNKALRGVPCSLLENCGDAEPSASEKLQDIPRFFHDKATRHCEDVVISQFLLKQRPEFAVAVYSHRKALAARVGTVTDKRSGMVTDFADISETFRARVMAAYQALGQHEEAVYLYMDMLERGQTPFHKTTTLCLESLLAMGEHDAVRELYHTAQQDGRPVSPSFYWKVLNFATSKKDTALTETIRADAKTRGVALPLDGDGVVAPQDLFQARMKSRVQWIEELGGRNAIDTMLHAIYQCYRPLYEHNKALRGVACSLLENCGDAEPSASEKLQDFPKYFNDKVTRLCERAVAREFMNKKRPELAALVYDHRKAVAAIVKDGNAGDFADVSEGFSAWEMAVFHKTGKHEEAASVYMGVLERGEEPSEKMTTSYVQSLVRLGEYDAARDLYNTIKDGCRSEDTFFYSDMLTVASTVRDTTMMREIRETMKAKSLPMTCSDYFHAIRSLDGHYFYVETTETIFTELESYQDCIDCFAEHKASPDAYAAVFDACREVLQLFDEMVEVNIQVEHDERVIFARVIKAALLLQDFQRVIEYAALCEKMLGVPSNGRSPLKQVTSAFLLRNEPEAAWEYALRVYDVLDPEQKRLPVPCAGVVKSLSDIVKYLGEHQNADPTGDLTHKLLDALTAKACVYLLNRSDRKIAKNLLNRSDRKIAKKLLRQNKDRVLAPKTLEMLRESPNAYWAESPNSMKSQREALMASMKTPTPFHRVLATNKRLVEVLADHSHYDTMLRVVSDCYKPLYEKYDALDGVACPLATSGPKQKKMQAMRLRWKEFDVTTTQHLEAKVMDLFLTKKRPDLAVAVYNHRQFLTTKFKGKKKPYADFTKHLEETQLSAMRAFQALAKHDEVVRLYTAQEDAGQQPTAAMTEVYEVSMKQLSAE